jgi:large subunit ribosomal protein L31
LQKGAIVIILEVYLYFLPIYLASAMKSGIHPNYNEITVILSDGSEIKTRSTMSTKDGVYKSEIDSKNHPFYNKDKTIQKKAGQIDRFNKRYNKK